MTSSAHALGSVLSAGPGFEAPGLEAFYPHPLWTFSLLGVDFSITRITLILWIATLAIIAFLVATVRNPQIVPGKLQFLGETGYSLVRDGIARHGGLNICHFHFRAGNDCAVLVTNGTRDSTAS